MERNYNHTSRNGTRFETTVWIGGPIKVSTPDGITDDQLVQDCIEFGGCHGALLPHNNNDYLEVTVSLTKRTERPLPNMTSLSDLVEMPIPLTGPVEVIRDNVLMHFGQTRIFQHGGDFRMINDGDNGFKITISPDDALWVINRLGLEASIVPPNRRSVIWS